MTTSVKLGVVMDPIGTINPRRDTSLAMLLEAQQRGWKLTYMLQSDLFLRNGEACARMRELRVFELQVFEDTGKWFELGGERTEPLGNLDVVLMRKDPPFDMEYIYTTYILEQAERAGVLVVNRASSLRNCNEKLSTARFPQCTAPTLVSRDVARIRAFAAEQGEIVLKPLDMMGGYSIFRTAEHDPNLAVLVDMMTQHGARTIMAQRYLPEIAAGDRRILVIDGEPIPCVLVRIPAPGQTRANIAAGATATGEPLSTRDLWICEQLRPLLREAGLLFAGLDVIGGFLTEINVTSPTGTRDIEKFLPMNIAGVFIDAVERRLNGDR